MVIPVFQKVKSITGCSLSSCAGICVQWAKTGDLWKASDNSNDGMKLFGETAFRWPKTYNLFQAIIPGFGLEILSSAQTAWSNCCKRNRSALTIITCIAILIFDNRCNNSFHEFFELFPCSNTHWDAGLSMGMECPWESHILGQRNWNCSHNYSSFTSQRRHFLKMDNIAMKCIKFVNTTAHRWSCTCPKTAFWL